MKRESGRNRKIREVMGKIKKRKYKIEREKKGERE